jgi:translation initiation factor 2D
MFKKKFKVSTQTLVSNKDKKHIINILKQVYNESEVDKLITTHSEIRQDKLPSSKDSIYTLISDEEGEVPILACHEAKGNILELLPTIYALFKVPFLVPTRFYLKTGVESFITNGAHLMWPGVHRVEYRPEAEQIEVEEEVKGKDITFII